MYGMYLHDRLGISRDHAVEQVGDQSREYAAGRSGRDAPAPTGEQCW